jgi:nitrilase
VIESGDAPQRFELAARDGGRWRVGMSVCYDLRFPELYRALGADILLVPSAFTHVTGQAHWELLLRARAVENLAYVIAPAQGGTHENGRRTWGHTMVVDPWGVVIARRESGAGVVAAQLDGERIAQVRRQLPALDHRVL